MFRCIPKSIEVLTCVYNPANKVEVIILTAVTTCMGFAVNMSCGIGII